MIGAPRGSTSTGISAKVRNLCERVGVLDRESVTLELGVDAQRRTSPLLGGTSNGVLGRATVGW